MINEAINREDISMYFVHLMLLVFVRVLSQISY